MKDLESVPKEDLEIAPKENLFFLLESMVSLQYIGLVDTALILCYTSFTRKTSSSGRMVRQEPFKLAGVGSIPTGSMFFLEN